MKKVLALILSFLLIISTFGVVSFATGENVAKVGNTEYATIDDAIAAWTNGTTLTLLADVTLSDVIKLSSTEYHILDLGIYTMTAAKNKDAIQYVINGRSSASYALDIKADATNPGGITATGKAIVSHIKPSSGAPSKDRPITRFYGGVFNASYVVKQGGSGLFLPGAGYTGASAPYFYFYGGEYNGTIYTNRSMNQFHGGTFNGSMQMSVDSSAYTLVAGGTFKNLSNSMGSALNSDKFTIGSAKGVYDKEVYIDDNGNYVIAAAEPSEGIEAAVAKTPGTNDYLAYSKVATEGALNYTDVYMALEKNKSATVTVYADELDLSGSSFTGTIVVPEGKILTISNAPENLKVEGEGEVIFAQPVAKIGDTSYNTLEDAVAAANEGDTIVLLSDVVITSTVKVTADKKFTLDLNGYAIDGTENVRIALMTYGDVILKDSSAEQTGIIKAGIGTAGNAVNVCGGTFIMESGNIYSKNNALLIDEEACVVNINGGKITAETTTNNSSVMYISSTSNTVVNVTGGEMIGFNGILLWNNTEINVSGGTITGKSGPGIQGNGSKDNTKISITGGNVYGEEVGIYHPQGGELTISGNATVTGSTGVVVKGGNVTIAGGTITAFGEAADYAPKNSGFIGTGDALYVEHYDNSTSSENYGTPVVNITGGTFNSANGKAVGSYANPNNNVEALSGFITGGTFSSDVSDLCAEGLISENKNGKYEVAAKSAVATVNGVNYYDLQSAIDAANGGTVVLVSDIELDATVNVVKGADVTIDLNGHTITGVDTTDKSFGLIYNNGTLTINDTVGTGKISLSATIDSGWSRYSSVISNNPGGKLTVNGGTIEHLGGTAMAYGIDNLTNGKGTYAETIINDGTVKSTYSGIRQFLNGVEAQNILTINGGTVMSDNRAIFFQDPSASANSGTLTITANAKIYGKVHLSVTEGSTEWPVEVSVAAEALQGESAVTNNYLPEGYTIENKNGIYGVEEVVEEILDTRLYYVKGFKPAGGNETRYGFLMTIGIDSLDYKSDGCGFYLTVGGLTKRFVIENGVVWDSFTVELPGETVYITPEQFGAGNKYIMNYTVYFADADLAVLGDMDVSVQGFVTTFDGVEIKTNVFKCGKLAN